MVTRGRERWDRKTETGLKRATELVTLKDDLMLALADHIVNLFHLLQLRVGT